MKKTTRTTPLPIRICIGISIGILLLLLLLISKLQGTPKLEVILNTLKASDFPPLTLYYANLEMSSIDAYDLDGKQLKKDATTYTSYTEGFLPKKVSSTYVKLINKIRVAEKLPSKHYFHDFYEDPKRVIISFSGALENIYIINKKPLEVFPIRYEEKDNLGNMYVSHIRQVDDKLYLLGNEANNFASFVYTLDPITYQVLDSISIPTTDAVKNQFHCGITSIGDSIFLEKDKLKVYTPQKGTYSFINLPFPASHVYTIEDTVLTVGIQKGKLQYTLFDNNWNVVSTDTFALSNIETDTEKKLVSATITNNLLMVTCYDPTTSAFPNTISLFDLSTKQMVYHARIAAYRDKALLEVNTTSLVQ